MLLIFMNRGVKMAGSIKGIIVEIGGDTSGLQKALSKVNSATSSLSRELRGINSLLKLDPKNTELLSQKQKVLNEEISTTEEKLKTLRKFQEEADKTIAAGGEISQEKYRALQREIIATEQRLRQLNLENSKWTTAGRSMEQFGTKLTNVSTKVENLGNKLSRVFTVGILGIGALATKSAIDFETAFTGVEKTVDGTKEQMEELKEGIKKMATELPSTTTEISAVAEAAGQLGIQTDNILSFSKAMIDLGNSTNLTSEEAASQLAKFANIMQMSQKDFDKLGSSIVDLGNNFATTETDIVEMAMRLAGAGKQVGLSEGQVLGLATALSSVGIEAEMGGSAISKAMVKMQNSVELGGDKLNTVLKKTGLTLRELELMSANDSKGFKEMSQSIGMTSTEVKQLITAGTNLEDFARISGMTTEKFKKEWKEDAVGALTAFIKGLGDAESKGETAITMLSEMGLTEVRLRDSLLRAANAGNLFNDAIGTGTKAWEENTALTNEANKRYETLESRLKKTKNKANNFAINLGNKLTPSINGILDRVDSFIKRLDNLSEKETENIIKIGLMVAAAGPFIKIIGKIGTTVGTTAKGIGTFSQAIGVLKTGGQSASASVNNLAKVLGALTSPAGLATLGIAGVSAAVIYFATKETEAQKKAREFAEEMANSKQALEEYNKSIDETTNANLSHIDSVSRLKDGLVTLVDENGKVKKGYESRVSFILNELNEALGTEYKLNGDIIDNYKKLQDEIDTTIEKKKAEIQLNAEEEKYKNAIENQKEAVESLKTAQENLGMSIDEARSKYAELRDIVTNPNRNKDKLYTGIGKDINELKNLISAYEDAEWQVKEYTNNVKDYEEDYAKFTEGKYSEIGNTIKASTEDWAAKTLEEINKSIGEQGNAMQQYKKIYEDTGNQVALQLSQQAQQNLDNLTQELVKKTQTLNELGPQEIEAWKNIATQSYSSYSEEIAKMAPEMQQKIQDVTGVIAGGTPQMQEKAEELGRKMVEEFDKSADAKQKALNTITGYLKGLSDADKRELLKQAGIENADIVIDELNKGNLSEENGKNILKGLWAGLKNNTWQGKILGAASGLAQAVNKAFTGKDGWDEHSPSKKMKKFAEYYIQPISDVMEKRKNSIVASASRLADKVNSTMTNKLNIPLNDYKELQGNLNSKIVDSTKTVFTTPQIVFNVQELDEAKLQQCFNYINRKFGSAY